MDWTFWLIILAVVVLLVLLGRRRKVKVVPPSDWQRDVLYLYMFKRKMTKGVVNLSPFAIKVETWLRLHKIKYEAVETFDMSPKRGQIPYAWFNGEWLEDSSLIITRLAKHFNISLNDGLTDEQVAASRAFTKMVEESTSMTIFLYRYVQRVEEYSRVFQPQLYSSPIVNHLMMKFLKLRISIRAYLQGVGRNSPEQNAEMAREDIRAISRYLGDKRYFMGDKMTVVDCSIFGMLSQVAFVDMSYPHKDPLQGECSNLQQYLIRIQETLWPDWHLLCDVDGKFH